MLFGRLLADGTWSWLRRAGGTYDEVAYALAVNRKRDAAMIAGTFQSIALFPGTGGNLGLRSVASNDAFAVVVPGDPNDHPALPVITLPPALSVTNGATIDLSPAIDSSRFGITATGLPDGWVVDPFTGRTTGTALSSGTAIVTMVVSNEAGASQASTVITIQPTNSPPVANFSATPLAGSAPLTVQFTDQSGNAPTAWAWDFDNNGTVDSIAQHAQFTFTNAGTYTVKLTVTNMGGQSAVVATNLILVTNFPGQFLSRTLNFGGQSRSYQLYVPPTYTGSTNVPLLLHLHGHGVSGDRVATNSGWKELSLARNFIVAFPTGGDAAGGVGFGWNNFFTASSPDDLGFLLALIQQLRAEFAIDATRLFMSGHSEGAQMTTTFASVYGDQLAGIAPVNGAWITTYGLPESLLMLNVPMPVWQWRGGNENFTTGLEARPVQDAKQNYWWEQHNHAFTLSVRQTNDGRFTYTDETYRGGVAEVRFTETLGQGHAYQPEYSTRIWNEFFSKLTRTNTPAAPAAVTLGSTVWSSAGWDYISSRAIPPEFHCMVSASNSTKLVIESTTKVTGNWLPTWTNTVQASHRMRVMDTNVTSPARFYRVSLPKL